MNIGYFDFMTYDGPDAEGYFDKDPDAKTRKFREILIDEDWCHLKLQLIDTDLVWQPQAPTLDLIKELSREGRITKSIHNKKVLDIGTGSGIIGIFALMYGAKFVTMSDINPKVAEIIYGNLIINHMEAMGEQFAFVDSDVFNGILDKFDTIISNPPVQPEYPLAHMGHEGTAVKYNETSDGGRYVLNSLIKYGRRYLEPGGKLYILCSSRHGHAETQAMLDLYFGRDNWHTIYAKEYQLSHDYHGPYMDFWLTKQAVDNDIRVYARDVDGHVVHPDYYDQNLKWYSQSYIIEATNMVNLS